MYRLSNWMVIFLSYKNNTDSESPIDSECCVPDVSILNSKQLLLKDKIMIQSLIAGFLSVEGTSISLSFFAASNDTLKDRTDICQHPSWNY